MQLRKIGRKASIASLLVGGMLAGSVALAAWVATGTGSGYAEAGTAAALTTSVTATTADLYPGGSGDLFIRINNPNPYPVLVTDIARTASPITSDAGAACNASTGVSMADQSGLSIAVAAGGSTTTSLDGVVAMSNASANACQGAVFTIPVTLTGQSNA